MDMLSIRKERLHGMKDERWLTKDKIVQYKGLINLYKRDQKISNTDKNIENRRTKALLTNLKRRIGTTYEQLENALFGDKQKIKNVLSEDRRVQLAYQYLKPGVIIEHVEQENFTYRKKLDLLQFQKLQKARRLVQLKLEISELEDMLQYFAPGSLPIEKQSNLYTALVQDANLKKEAAIVVNGTYKKVLSVMRKDQIYFDQILLGLSQDAKRQSKCMVDTIKMGQLAIEYLDDRKAEFQALEYVVHKDMITRKETVETTRDVVMSLSKNVRFYIRRDSDMDLSICSSNYNILHEVTSTGQLMDQLQSCLFVNDYREVFNFVTTQSEQRARLKYLKDRILVGRDCLRNRMDHAVLMHTTMCNTMSEGTQDYINEKSVLKRNIMETQRVYNVAVEGRQLLLKTMHNIKISLQQTEQMCKVLVDPKRRVVTKMYHRQHYSAISKEETQADIVDIKEDCSEIIEILERKLLKLLDLQVEPITDDRIRSLADVHMQKLMTMRGLSVLKEGPQQAEYISGFLDDLKFHEDATIPSRADIKAQSKEIVLLCAVVEDEPR